MKLIEKARQFDEIIQQQHTPLGLAVDLVPSTDEKPIVYLDVEDSAIWTGIYIASQAFRFAVTSENEASKNMERSLSAIHDLRMITGKEGLIARGILKGKDPSVFSTDGYKGTGNYQGYVWNGGVSRDQYLGVFYGMGIAYLLIQNSEAKDRLVEDVRSLANHIVDNNLRIIDIDGKPTQYGNFSSSTLGMDGLGPIMALAVIKIACSITGDDKFKHYYEKQLIKKEGYHTTSRRWLRLGLTLLRNHVNYNLAFLSLYSLISFETESKLKSLYLQLLENIWQDIQDELNSFFNFIHHGLNQKASVDNAIKDALESLQLFPIPLVNKKIENSKDPSIPKAILRDRKGRRQSRYPLPMDRRVRNNFIWKENPRCLDGGADNGRTYHPVGYLIAYWMGRYYKFISDDE